MISATTHSKSIKMWLGENGLKVILPKELAMAWKHFKETLKLL